MNWKMRNDLLDQHRTLSQNSKCCIHLHSLHVVFFSMPWSECPSCQSPVVRVSQLSECPSCQSVPVVRVSQLSEYPSYQSVPVVMQCPMSLSYLSEHRRYIIIFFSVSKMLFEFEYSQSSLNFLKSQLRIHMFNIILKIWTLMIYTEKHF